MLLSTPSSGTGSSLVRHIAKGLSVFCFYKELAELNTHLSEAEKQDSSWHLNAQLDRLTNSRDTSAAA